MFWDRQLEFSLEGYYKKMKGLLDYKEGCSFLLADDWQQTVTTGTGAAYGMEALLQKKYGNTTGWLGYTLSWANRQFEEINRGEAFPFKYDQRHDASLVLNHQISPKMDVGASWVFASGNAITVPVNQIPLGIFYPGNPSPFPVVAYGYESRNNYRMRDYHRLDLSLNLHKQLKHFKRTWSFSTFNTYNRKNPFFTYFVEDRLNNKRIFRQSSLFPIVPSVSYLIEF
jgi:hypothetical protein